MTKRSAVRTVKRKIAALRPHPRQAALFRDTDDGKFQELAEQMQARGQDEPVEITPDDTIIAGHRRVQAAQRLGWSEVEVWVREDLASAGPAAVEERLIQSNLEDHLARRQFDPIDLARCYKALLDLERRNRRNGLPSQERGNLRDRLAPKLSKSGRTLDRLLQLLDLPMPIQAAVSEKKLGYTAAIKLTALSQDVLREIAEAIVGGQKPKDAVRPHLPGRDQKHRHIGDAAQSLVRSLYNALIDFKGRQEAMPKLRKQDKATLRQSRKLIDQLLGA